MTFSKDYVSRGVFRTQLNKKLSKFHYRVKDGFECFCMCKKHKTSARNNVISDFIQISSNGGLIIKFSFLKFC